MGRTNINKDFLRLGYNSEQVICDVNHAERKCTVIWLEDRILQSLIQFTLARYIWVLCHFVIRIRV